MSKAPAFTEQESITHNSSPDAIVYEAINLPVLSRVPRLTKRLLDLGCGTGALGRRIKEEIDCQVTGITNSESEGKAAAKYLDQILVCDLNAFNLREAGKYDCIVCSHVLEHLYRPDQILKQLQEILSPGGELIVALPNVLYWKQRLEFMRGKFRYADGGLMDRTHYRFYDWESAQSLLIEGGYMVQVAEAIGSFPLSRYLFRFGSWLDRIALRTFPGFFGIQFVFVCRRA